MIKLEVSEKDFEIITNLVGMVPPVEYVKFYRDYNGKEYSEDELLEHFTRINDGGLWSNLNDIMIAPKLGINRIV